MSPEQVAGKEVDQRSDLFSLGVVLYEMITGRTPFARENDVATAQAIVSAIPDPLAKYRSNVSDDLQRIVSKLLEKDPAYRYQSAAGVASDLKQERRSLDSGESSVISVEALHPLPKKKLTKILIPTSALALIVLLLLVLKPWKFEVQPQQEAVAAENRLAIMYFDNLADSEDSLRLGEIVTNLLITDLSESRYVNVISSQRLYDILKQLGKEGQKRIDRDVASQVAQRARARWMLLGSILKVTPQIVITTRLVDVESGQVDASQQITGDTDEDIFSIVDKLTVEIKNDLSLPAAAQEEPDPVIAEVTTHSEEAYRYYLEGRDYSFKYHFFQAEKSYRKAVELDSTFAMAYFRLALINFFVSAGAVSAAHMSKAVEYSGNASRQEKLYVEAFQETASGNYADAVRVLERLTELFPQEKEAYLFLGCIHLFYLHDPEPAILAFRSAINVDPLYKLAYNYLSYAYNEIGNYQESDWAIDKYISLVPGEFNPYDTKGDLSAFQGKRDQAIASYQKALAIKPSQDYSTRKLGFMYLYEGDYGKAERCFRGLLGHSEKSVRQVGRSDLAEVFVYLGKYEEALTVLDRGIAADEMESGTEVSADKHWLKAMTYREKKNLSAALQEIQKCMEISRDSTTDYYRHYYAQLLAENKNIAEANAVAIALKKDLEEKNPSMMHLYWYAVGCVEFSKHNFRESAACFEKAADGVLLRMYESYPRMHLMLARAYLENDRLGEAIAEYEAVLSRDYPIPAIFLIVKAHYYLGRAYEESDWADKAIEQYETFLDIWKDADEGVPSIEDARARLARLKSKP